MLALETKCKGKKIPRTWWKAGDRFEDGAGTIQKQTTNFKLLRYLNMKEEGEMEENEDGERGGERKYS